MVEQTSNTGRIMGWRWNIEDELAYKRGGHFRVAIATDGAATITVERPGEPVEFLHCATPGLANQTGLQLSDMGLTGYVTGSDT